MRRRTRIGFTPVARTEAYVGMASGLLAKVVITNVVLFLLAKICVLDHVTNVLRRLKEKWVAV